MLPNWLTDCVCNDARAELYVVQAGTAHEMARSSRDRITQAVISIDSSIVKARGATLDEILADDGARALIASLGIGFALSEDVSLDLSRIRYGKIIVATDRSTVGRYVRSQVLGLYFRLFYRVLVAGHVYTLTIDKAALASEDAFTKAVINPATRDIVPVKLGTYGPEMPATRTKSVSGYRPTY